MMWLVGQDRGSSLVNVMRSEIGKRETEHAPSVQSEMRFVLVTR